ncbi:uncharacterized protein LOC125047921 [Penaeus chinensis]|uniref:uncharacterized protein LOC125047921 n=1 Tax=Penaeus chinensis TaxID=139456 RepID=UPI001FB6476A|nr:uncharacterized protein LOC125047921 [Penaeus chinensis]
MKNGKATGPDGIPIEAWKAMGEEGIDVLWMLMGKVMDEENIPTRKCEEPPWCILYADDIVLVAETKQELQRKMEGWRTALESRGLKISRKKTKYFTTDTEGDQQSAIQIDGLNLKRVEHFKYLGAMVEMAAWEERLNIEFNVNVQESTLRWYGHLLRRNEDHVGRQAMEMEIEGNRPRGRPKTRWKDVVQKDMREKHLDEAEAVDRAVWRRLIRNGDPE